MAENKGIMLAKSMQKHAGRAKEKILQNLGKVDRTADEIFDDHLNNFNRQQVSANRLQKEFNNYIRCIRAAQTASKSLMDAICEIYEPQWVGYDALQAQSAASESLWQDFAHKLGDQVLIPLNTYTGQFPEMKKKVEKRNRKLIDYDGQRHSFQNLQANNKRKDDVKLSKGRDQLEEARRTYEILNTELHDELPALYDSRILFLVTNLQTLFATEQVFHNETSKIYSELEAIVDKLATDSQRGSNTLRKQATNAIKSTSPVQSPVKQMNNTNINNSNYQNQITTNGSSNVNSPTSTSSSQQTSRLESISPTPESTPDNQRGGSSTLTASASSSSSPNTSAVVMGSPAAPVSEPSYQNAAAMLSSLASNNGTVVNSELNSPNANTTTTTATANSIDKSESSTIDTIPENDNEDDKKSTTKTNSDGAMNNGSNNSNSNTSNNTAAIPAAVVAVAAAITAAATITTPTASTSTSTTTLKGIKTPNVEQLNGNENGNTAAADVNNGNIEDNKKALGDATTADLPPGVLYRVKATYGYVKEDVDELSFEIGDIIRVIEYDDPEDQEEGWLMGQKEGTNEKGLFPANFTRPI